MMCFGLKDRKRTKTNHCVIVLLDDTQLVHELHASSTGQDLLDVVIKHLNLLETSYFGLKYLDSNKQGTTLQQQYQQQQQLRQDQMMGQVCWIDVNKSAIKQLKDVHPMTVYFGVKYYASDPCKLAEEITRYQFFLQCKQDILHSRLPVSFELAIELFALAVQSELGDYDPQRHQDGYVSEFQFLPNQTVGLEKRVALMHRNLTGQVPATAELNFLERIKWLDLYGCEQHPIQYEDNSNEYTLGINPNGVLVLRNQLRVAHYLWPRIVKTKCQGRCFLMDVIDNNNNNSNSKAGRNSSDRNRFGFRLADKMAARKLQWVVEEHKSFHHLINDSATLNQLAQRQQQQQQQQQQSKFSQRFRNSIRSAISVGPFTSFQQQQQIAAHHQKVLRSSLKLTNNNQNQRHHTIDARPPPAFVRVPSRRYGNKLLALGPYNVRAPNSSGNVMAPNVVGGAHTMLDGQRQQAIMMMNHLNQMNGLTAGKSQTLRPALSKSELKEAKKNPYYQMMLMMENHHRNQHQQTPEVAILPPGRHVVQPTIYKASSVVNGINQLGAATTKQRDPQDQAALAQNGTGLMLQLFDTMPRYPAAYGHESPRSTKSAIAPSSVLKLANKRLAKQQRQQQQQQILYSNQMAAEQLFAFGDPNQPQVLPLSGGQYYGMMAAPYNLSSSANVSPRSTKSARITNRHKSKSTNENLHLLHKYTGGYVQPTLGADPSKMLLATTHLLAAQNQLPQGSVYYGGAGNSTNNGVDDCGNKLQPTMISSKKRATFVLDDDQANLLLNNSNKGQSKQHPQMAGQSVRRKYRANNLDDYCCSRSDCSSAESVCASNYSLGQQMRRINQLPGQQRRRRTSGGTNEPAPQVQARKTNHNQPQAPEQIGWPALRDFNARKGLYVGSPMDRSNFSTKAPTTFEARASESHNLSANRAHVNAQNRIHNPVLKLEDINNNDAQNDGGNKVGSHLAKNMTNRQATPILLSMNHNSSTANNEAVHLLNIQRQQLASQSTRENEIKDNMQQPVDSGPSSVASSPKTNESQREQGLKSTATDSTTSSCTTSGYYAGSNSTGSVSVDSDSQANEIPHVSLGNRSNQTPHSGDGQLFGRNNRHTDGDISHSGASRDTPKHGDSMDGFRNSTTTHQNRSLVHKDDRSPEQSCNVRNSLHSDVILEDNDRQWSPVNRAQRHYPSSLKYVSFDV